MVKYQPDNINVVHICYIDKVIYNTCSISVNQRNSMLHCSIFIHIYKSTLIECPFKIGNHWNSSSTIRQKRRDRIVVSTSRCGRDNPGSNPGHGSGCAMSLLRHGGYFYRIQVTAVAVQCRCYGMAVIFIESRSRQWLWKSLLRHGGYF